MKWQECAWSNEEKGEIFCRQHKRAIRPVECANCGFFFLKKKKASQRMLGGFK